MSTTTDRTVEDVCEALGLDTASVLSAPSPDEIKTRRIEAKVRAEQTVEMPFARTIGDTRVHLYQVVREPTDNPLSDAAYREMIVHDLRPDEVRVCDETFDHDYRLTDEEFANRFDPVTTVDGEPVWGY